MASGFTAFGPSTGLSLVAMPPMSKEERYGRKAVEFAELAQRATSAADKAHMLRSAEAWLDRAKQSGRRIRNLGERPLTRATLAGTTVLIRPGEAHWRVTNGCGNQAGLLRVCGLG